MKQTKPRKAKEAAEGKIQKRAAEDKARAEDMAEAEWREDGKLTAEQLFLRHMAEMQDLRKDLRRTQRYCLAVVDRFSRHMEHRERVLAQHYPRPKSEVAGGLITDAEMSGEGSEYDPSEESGAEADAEGSEEEQDAGEEPAEEAPAEENPAEEDQPAEEQPAEE